MTAFIQKYFYADYVFYSELPHKDLDFQEKAKAENDRDYNCGICLEEFESTDDIRVHNTISKGSSKLHQVHRECINKWFVELHNKGKKPNCPICRAPLVLKKPVIKLNTKGKLGLAVVTLIASGGACLAYLLSLKAKVALSVSVFFGVLSGSVLLGIALTAVALRNSKMREIASKIKLVAAVIFICLTYFGIAFGAISLSASAMSIADRIFFSKLSTTFLYGNVVVTPVVIAALLSSYIE